MRWLDKLERHLGFMAIPNLMLLVVVGQLIALFMALLDPGIPLQLCLDPAAVEAGQWWRLFTWVIVPVMGRVNVLLSIFWFLFLLTAGRTLEQEWGAFKCTLYLVLGVALPSLGAMFLWHFFGVPTLLTGWYFSVTLQLAFAAIVPDYTVLLMFVLPIKMRWMAWFLGALLLFEAFTSGWSGFFQVLFGTGNYLIFFVPLGIEAWRRQQLSHAGKAVFREAKREAARTVARTCAVCGVGVEAGLRLCTCERCGENGLNYCPEHLILHLAVPEKIGSPLPPKKKRKS